MIDHLVLGAKKRPAPADEYKGWMSTKDHPCNSVTPTEQRGTRSSCSDSQGSSSFPLDGSSSTFLSTSTSSSEGTPGPSSSLAKSPTEPRPLPQDVQATIDDLCKTNPDWIPPDFHPSLLITLFALSTSFRMLKHTFHDFSKTVTEMSVHLKLTVSTNFCQAA